MLKEIQSGYTQPLARCSFYEEGLLFFQVSDKKTLLEEEQKQRALLVLLAGNSKYSSVSKHAALEFASLRQWVKENKLVSNFVSTKDQPSDILTKFCAKMIFVGLRKFQ